MHEWCQIQHYPSLSCKYFRFWCRHGLLKGSIYKYSIQQRHINYSNRCTQVFYEGGRTIVTQRNMHAWYIIQHGDVETGSSYKFGCEEGRNAIPTPTPRFSRMPIVKWNTTRHRNMHSRNINQHFDAETVSSYKFGWEQGRNVIPTATPRFSMTPRRVEHYPTSKYARMVPDST